MDVYFSVFSVKIFASQTESPYLSGRHSANIPEAFTVMAKARVSTNPMYTGGAGGYSFYVRDGEQVVRQRRNNSNYGESASRSEAQQSRRVRWANLVNFFKSISSWQPKAYESKVGGQTDYNLFMSLNVNYSQIGLTKDMAVNGCACVAGYTVSRGSLPKIERAATDLADPFAMAVKLSNNIGANTTVGDFAADVLANNPEFINNDNIAFIIFKNYQQSNNFPYVLSVYKEVTLDPTSTDMLADKVGSGRFEKTAAGNLKINVGEAGSYEAGFVLIHTRKSTSSLQVSTQSIQVTSEGFWQEYSYPEWIQQCIQSYGVDSQVPLDPYEPPQPTLETVFDLQEEGDGDNIVAISPRQLQPGQYRVTLIPENWLVSEVAGDSDTVFGAAVSSDSSLPPASTTQIKKVTKGEMTGGVIVKSFDFVVRSDKPYLAVSLRANEGVSIEVLLERYT